MKTKTYWALWWHSKGSGHIIHQSCVPALFKTRKQALEFREKTFGYIRKRPDLRAAPFFWRLPKPIKVTVSAA
jgi:hypothetical protein